MPTDGCRDSRGAADCWEHVNYLPITVSPACSSPPLSSSHQPPEAYSEMCGYNCVLLTISTHSFSLPLYLLIEPEPAFNSPCCASSCSFHPTFLSPPFPNPPPCWAASSHILALLINNPTARSQHSAFLAALCLTSPLKRMSDGASS